VLPLLADTPETPVGMLIAAGDAKVLRANTETPLDAKPPDLLFTGDSIRTGTAPATFLFCGGKATETLGPAGEARLESTQVKVKTGKITDMKPAGSCFLPQTLRVATASQQHYGVSMTRGFEKPDIPPTPHDKLPPAVLADLAPFEKAAAENPNDPSPLVAMATVYETAKLPANALEAYDQLRTKFPDAVWVKAKIFDLQQALAEQVRTAAAAVGTQGETYAILIGISKYKNPELALQFADKDATSFGDALTSPRGGAIRPENILVLTNEKATTAAIRNGFQSFLKQRAGKKDTVIVMIAGHGVVEAPGSKKAFILTYDTDPQDLQSTALPMPELQDLFKDQLSRVGRVLMFVDVCKAGVIGTINNLGINSDVQHLGEVDGDLFLFLASRPREKSLESPDFGGGHGAFSYFLVKGMMGDADEDKNNKVDIDELIKYVTNSVEVNTKKAQHPNYSGQFEGSSALSDLSKPGIQLSHLMLYDSKNGEPLYFAAAVPQQLAQDPAIPEQLQDFERAISQRRLLPGDPGNAFDLLDRLRPSLAPEVFATRQNELRVALENRAQEILLRYLAGDQIPQTQADFVSGMRDMEVARKLTPESLFLEGREDFFRGRSMLFDKQYPQAAALLEQAIRIDSGLGYAYNALGIAYLEQAQFEKAIPAFRDAARRAQHWAYPLHNLALAYTEAGDYDSAIRSYQQAMRLAPTASYLPYNLGLVYERTGRKKDAEKAYRRAMELGPDSAEPFNALGTLKAADHKFADAEKLYRQALAQNPKLLAARNNLALLLSSRPERLTEAVQLWRQNLTDSPDHLSSRLSLADALAVNGQVKDAIAEYQAVISQKPEYLAARIALARLLVRDNRPTDALQQLREAAQREPRDATVQIMIGDLELAGNNQPAALAAYQSALELSFDSSTRKSIQRKIRRLQASKP
jgi:tetratricopeptide (TPR) repeat protein